MFKLILKYQDTVVEEREFDNTPVTIGRREDNDLVIDNMAVSGHHAILDRQEDGAYVLVDRDSLNGTYLNEQRISRELVYEGDEFIVGKHILQFVDMRPKSEQPVIKERTTVIVEQPPDKTGRADRAIAPDQTETVNDSVRESAVSELDQPVEAKPMDTAPPPEESQELTAARPKKVELFGSLTILSGGVPEIVDLSKRLTTIGKSDEADIKCSGFMVGKIAAHINKRPNGFFLAYSEGLKKPEVNGQAIGTNIQLHDGDEITVGNTRITFNLREEIVY
jgi:pSer/pThr/pTyr-binding forkhead associated (FHA) protein